MFYIKVQIMENSDTLSFTVQMIIDDIAVINMCFKMLHCGIVWDISRVQYH